MRIVSLLPSLTELVYALGRGDELVGATHECDFPEGVERLPRLTRSNLPAASSSAEIDALVSARKNGLYSLDEAMLAALAPDLILTQEQCDVCAVNEVVVRRAAHRLPSRPHVESVNPLSLDGLFAMFRRVGDLLDARPAAESLIDDFRRTAEVIAGRLGRSPRRPRVLLLEWLDPPYCSGHWNPEIIAQAGGLEAVGRAGEPSRRIAWDAAAEARPDVVILSLCGFNLDRAEQEWKAFADRPEAQILTSEYVDRMAVVDGSAYFSRPGPRLETSLRIAAAALHPDRLADLAPPEGQGWRFVFGTP